MGNCDHTLIPRHTALIEKEMCHCAAPWKAGMAQQQMSCLDRKIRGDILHLPLCPLIKFGQTHVQLALYC